MKKLFGLFLLTQIFLTCQKELPEENVRGKILYYSENNYLYAYDLASTEKHRVGSTSFGVRWSHKGDKIAINTSSQLIIIDAYTYDTLLIRSLNMGSGGLAWSQDDTEIAYTVQNGSKIYRMNLQTFAMNEITIPNGYTISGRAAFDWSSTTNLFLFQANVLKAKLCTISTDSSNFKELLADAFFDNPRFSPDGKRIAYSDYLDDLYLVDVSGSNKSLFWKNALNPCWSKDGSMIMATYIKSQTISSATFEIHVKEVNGKKREATIVGAQANLADWYSE